MRPIECVMDSNSKANRGRPSPSTPSPVPGGLEPDLSCVRTRFRNRLYERNDHTAEASIRRQSGALARRRVLHPPHSMLLLLSGEPVNSWIVGNPEVIQMLTRANRCR